MNVRNFVKNLATTVPAAMLATTAGAGGKKVSDIRMGRASEGKREGRETDMLKHLAKIVVAGVILAMVSTASASIVVTMERRTSGLSTDGTFVFDTIPSNTSTDLANGLTFDVLAGSAHGASPSIAKLTDGPAQTNSDHLAESWLTTDDFVGARIQLDLAASTPITEINTYSWHANTRPHQIYSVFGALAPSNNAPDFDDAALQDDAALAALGYTLIASVNTWEDLGGSGGQVGVSIAGDIGNYRYILFDIATAPSAGGAARATFYGEIDIIPEPGTPPPGPTLALTGHGSNGLIGDSPEADGYRFTTLDASLEVNWLGLYDAPNGGEGSVGDDLLEEHRVSIWRESDRVLMAQTVVQPGDELVGVFRGRSVDPVLLAPNTAYVIAADYATAADRKQSGNDLTGWELNGISIQAGDGRYGGVGGGMPTSSWAIMIGPTFGYTLGPLSVTLTSPADSQSYETDAAITATADVSEPGPFSNTVTFHVTPVNPPGPTVETVSPDTSSPFSADLGALPVGTYEIYATVVNDNDPPDTDTSATHTFTVAEPLPVKVDATAFWRNQSNADLGGTFDASGSDKLVFVATGEHGSNQTGNGWAGDVFYDGVQLTAAVKRQPIKADPDAGILVDDTYNAIYFLDNPGSVHVDGVITTSGFATRGSVAVLALSGTIPGVGNTVIGSRDTNSADLTTAAGSIVVGSYGLGGTGNTSQLASITTPEWDAEVVRQVNGNNWDGHVVAYQNNVSSGTKAYTFDDTRVPDPDGRTGRHVIVAEFLAALPDPDPDESTVEASPTSVPADGIETSTITVTLRTAGGAPVADRLVKLESISGPGDAVISPADPVTTNADGVATFTVSSNTISIEEFRATDVTDEDNNIIITQTASVAFEIVLQTSLIPGYTPPPPPAPDAPQTSLAMTTAGEPPPAPEEQAVQETSEVTEPVEDTVPGVIRVTEYYLTTGDFAGTATTVALEQDLADDYFILVRGSRAGNGLSMPDNDYARVAAVPGGRGGLADSGAADAIGLQRAAAAFDWEGVVTVVEAIVPDSPAGFRLVDAVVTTLSGTSGNQICAPWGDASQVVPFGGYRGGGAELTGGAANRYQGTSVFVRLSVSGNDTLVWERDAGGENLVDATMTTFVVEWGADWTVQHAAVAGSAGGDGADATDAYATAAIAPVARANTWVWGTGIRANSGIGNCAESCLVTLGDGVNLNATESAVAVGSEYTDAYSFNVYALTHPALAVDHRFKPDGDLKGLDIPVAVDSAASGARFAWLYNGCNGTSSRFPRPRMWSRYTADDTITVSRGYDGAQFPAWVQGIDFSALSE